MRIVALATLAITASVAVAAPPQATPSGSPTVSGVVRDAATGRPIVGATVAFDLIRTRSEHRSVTDSAGRFTFASIAPGRYRLWTIPTGYSHRGGRQTLTVASAAIENIELALHPLAVITGMIRDEGGNPMPGIRVELLAFGANDWRPGWQRFSEGGGDAMSDARGEYRFADLEPGEFLVFVRSLAQERSGRGGSIATTFYRNAQSLTGATPIHVAEGEVERNIDIVGRMQSSVRVAGNLKGVLRTGSHASVSLYPADSASREVGIGIAYADVNAAGAFVFRAVPPGRYVIEAQSRSPRFTPAFWGQHELVVDTKDVSGIAVPMSATYALTGVVRTEGAATGRRVSMALVPIATRLARWAEDAGSVPQLAIDSAGRLTATGILPGSYVLSTHGSLGGTLNSVTAGGRDITDLPIEFGPGRDVPHIEITMATEPAILQGIVRTPDGTPSQEAFVMLFSPDRKRWQPFGDGARSTGVEGGRYVFFGVRPGEYYLAALPAFTGFNPRVLDSLIPSAITIRLPGGTTRRDLQVPR